MEVTEYPESCSDAVVHPRRVLPEMYWAAAKEIGELVHERLLP
eukprot:SAG11_NODE_21604_length_422_cov_0.640867_2_plen_43_part_00